MNHVPPFRRPLALLAALSIQGFERLAEALAEIRAQAKAPLDALTALAEAGRGVAYVALG